MRIADLEKVKQEAAESFRRSRLLYESLLLLTGTESSLMRVNELFDMSTFSEEPQKLTAYENVTTFAKTTFDNTDDFVCEATQGTCTSEHCDFELTMTNGAKSGWFAFEISLPWSDLRAAKRLSMTVFGGASSESYLDVQLYFRDLNDNRVAIFDHKPSTLIQPNSPFSRIDAEFTIPDEAQIDFDQEPEIAIFIDPKVENFYFSDWFLGFE